MKKCRITRIGNGFAVRGTNFLNHSDADLYAYYLANTLNNGGKLIYVTSVEEAIEKHNQLEGQSNDDWLRLCWKRNTGAYLHTQNMYALKDNPFGEYKLFVGFKKLGEFISILEAKQYAHDSGLYGAFNLLGKDSYSDSWYKFKPQNNE